MLIIDKNYYIHWFIFSFILLFFIIYISFRIIPTKKALSNLKKLFMEYKNKFSQSEEYQTSAQLLAFSCPLCKYESNYGEFLGESKCPKCESKLWSTVINEKGPEYYEIYQKHQQLENFINTLGFRDKKKLRKMLYYEDLEK